jgi:putative transposase
MRKSVSRSWVVATKTTAVRSNSGDYRFADLLTLHRIEMPPALRVSFYTTNLIDSAFANPRYGINRVKRWRKNSDMIKRWLGAHLLDQEQRFRRVKGFKEIAGFLARFAGLTQIAIDKEDVA